MTDNEDRPDPIGAASARERGATSFLSIDVIENVGSDLQLVICDQHITGLGGMGTKFEKGAVRLTAADQDRLIEALTLARSTR